MNYAVYDEARILKERKERRRQAREARRRAEELDDEQERVALQAREDARKVRALQRRQKAIEMREKERGKAIIRKKVQDEQIQSRLAVQLNQKLEEEKVYLVRKEEILQQKVEFEASKASRRKKIVRRKENLQNLRQQEAEVQLDEKIQILDEIEQQRKGMHEAQRRAKMMERIDKLDEVMERQEALLEAKRLRAKERVKEHARRVLELRERQRRLKETVKTDRGDVILVPAKDSLDNDDSPFSPSAYDPQTGRSNLSGMSRSRSYRDNGFDQEDEGDEEYEEEEYADEADEDVDGDERSHQQQLVQRRRDRVLEEEQDDMDREELERASARRSEEGPDEYVQDQEDEPASGSGPEKPPQLGPKPRRETSGEGPRDSRAEEKNNSRRRQPQRQHEEPAESERRVGESPAASTSRSLGDTTNSIYAQIEALKKERLALMEEEKRRLAEEDERLDRAREERARIREELSNLDVSAASEEPLDSARGDAQRHNHVQPDSHHLQLGKSTTYEDELMQEDRDFDALDEGTPVTVLPKSGSVPRRVTLFLKEDDGCWIVSWHDARNPAAVSPRIDLQDCYLSRGVGRGLFRKSMYQIRYKPMAHLCFSLLMEDGSLDVICTHEEHYMTWMRVLKVLLP